VGQLISFCIVFHICRCFFGGTELYAQIQKQLALTERVLLLLTETPEKINSVRDLAEAKKIKGNVTFKNVAFSYHSEKKSKY
jgi:ABC-type bacteriocin/lantibiotic exporter with double-glycine peptidase domain